jgi:hypothetical protein
MAYVKFKLEHSINVVNNSYLLIPLLTLETQKSPYKSRTGRNSGKSSVQYGGTCDRNILESGKEVSANNTVSPLLLPLPALVNGRYVTFYILKSTFSLL